MTRTGGIQRGSVGEVTYSARHRLKFEMDAEAVMHLLRDVVPYGAPEWSLHKLERAFYEQHGRLGWWNHYKIPFDVFLSLFPRTFVVFGAERKFARVLHRSRTHIVDDGE